MGITCFLEMHLNMCLLFQSVCFYGCKCVNCYEIVNWNVNVRNSIMAAYAVFCSLTY